MKYAPPHGRRISSAVMFTPEETRRGSERGVAARQRRMAERSLRSEVVWRIVTEIDDIHPAALDGALQAITRTSDALQTVPVETPLDAKRLAETAEILHRVSRLASGQSTSNVLHGQALSPEERAATIAELRERILSDEAG